MNSILIMGANTKIFDLIYIKLARRRITVKILYHELKFADLEQVEWVEKIPPMVRLNGFSAFDKGKGVYQEFKDTLTDKKVYVFVDNFEQQKIRLLQKDSAQLFLNLKDSLETVEMFEFFKAKIEEPHN